MAEPLRRRIRHARRWTGYGLLVLLILLALLVGVANQLLPMVERHPDRIAAWLSARTSSFVWVRMIRLASGCACLSRSQRSTSSFRASLRVAA